MSLEHEFTCEEPPYFHAVLSLWKGVVQPRQGPVQPVARRVLMAEIISDVAIAYGLTVDELKGPDRSQRTSVPRQHAMWIMAKQPHLSFPKIGRFLSRDHTTIVHGVSRHQARIDAGTVEVSL